MTEIEKTLTIRASLKETTKQVYRNTYTKLRGLLHKDIIDSTEKFITDTILEADLKPSGTQSLLNIAIVVREALNFPIEALKVTRNKTSGELLVASVLKNEKLKNDLPTFKDLLNYLDDLYKNKEWRKFLVNYLLITLNVRNLDLNLKIVKTSKVVNNKDNWLVLHKNNAEYIRYIYKTADAYDSKTNIITNKNAMEAIKNILGEKESVYLLEKENGERINIVSLNKMISRMTIKTELYKEGIGQANVLKIILNENGDIKNFSKISKNRGTQMGTLNTNYNLNYEMEPKKEKLVNEKSMKRIPDTELGLNKKADKRMKKEKELMII